MFMADDVLQALAFLFGELSELDQERRDAAAAAALGLPAPVSSASTRAVIDPTALRDALDSLSGQEFKIGERCSSC
jgi:chitinase